MSSPIHSVSPLWRERAVRAGNVQGLRLVARVGYRIAAKWLARRLGGLTGVTGVALRGGALSAPVPGISDIDLTLFIDDGLSAEGMARLLLEGRRRYPRLKSRCPLLGEILVLRPRDVARARTQGHSLQSSILPYRRLCGEVPVMAAGVVVTGRSRYLLGFELFRRMQTEYHALGPYAVLRDAFCRRLAEKIFRLCGHPGLTAEALSMRDVFVEAFLAVEALAETALAETDGASSFKPARNADVSGAEVQPTPANLRWWMTANRRLHGVGRLDATADDRLFLWNGPSERAALRALFGFSLLPLEEPMELPVVMGRAAASCRSMALCMQGIEEAMRYADRSRLDDGRWRARFESNLELATRDRLLAHCYLFPHHLLASSREAIDYELRLTADLAERLGDERWDIPHGPLDTPTVAAMLTLRERALSLL